MAKKKEKLFEIIIPKMYAPKGEDAMYVSVNDEAVRIKYGEKVRIPERFKEAVEESFRADGAADAYGESVRFSPSV
mgnify:FL=1